MDITREYAIGMDARNDLSYREEFYIKEDGIYLDGNSLGLLSKRAEKSLLELLDSWKHHAIDGWTEGDNPWFYLSEKLGKNWRQSWEQIRRKLL